MLYLFAFSRTERVRKLIQIPSLFPKIHSRIPAHEQTVRENRPLWTCTQQRLRTDVSSVQTEALVHGQSEGVLRDRGETSKPLWRIRTEKDLNQQPPPVPQGATGRTGLTPVSMPMYPAKFVDLKTVWFFLLKSRFTTRGLSFSVMIHDLFFKSHLWGEQIGQEMFSPNLKTWSWTTGQTYPMNKPKSKFLAWNRLPVREEKPRFQTWRLG